MLPKPTTINNSPDLAEILFDAIPQKNATGLLHVINNKYWQTDVEKDCSESGTALTEVLQPLRF